jgi:hypothetical protein
MNDPLDWDNSPTPSEESWQAYFNLLLHNIKSVITTEYNEFYDRIPMYDDPNDFINGFTLAGAFFQGLGLEPDEDKRKEQIVHFRKSLAIYLVHIISQLEHEER